MSNPDGDAAARLSAALEKILQRREADDTDAPTTVETPAVGDDPDDPDQADDRESLVGEHDELPAIVPATAETAIDPQVPPRQRVGPPARRPGAVAASAATQRPAAAPRTYPTVSAPAGTSATVAATAVRPVTPATAAAPVPVTAWGDHVPVPPARSGVPLRAPGRRPRVRRVTRVVRHVDPWSVFKVALLFSFVGYLVVLTSGVLLWRVADSTGTLDNIERWFTQFGWETFEFDGGEIFSNAWVIGLFVAVGMTGAAVLMATLFNLVSDIVGGVRVTVLEEEVVERTAASTRRYVVRRPPLAGGGLGTASQWKVDDDEPATVAQPAQTPMQPVASVSPVTTPAADWSVDDDGPIT